MTSLQKTQTKTLTEEGYYSQKEMQFSQVRERTDSNTEKNILKFYFIFFIY